MEALHDVIEAVLRPDGSLELARKPGVPPGRVQLIVQSMPGATETDPFLQSMERIWAAREAAGLTPRSVADVEAERKALRDEMDAEIEAAGRLQEESGHPREDSPEGHPSSS